MKIAGNLLALCVVSCLSGATNAFVPMQPPSSAVTTSKVAGAKEKTTSLDASRYDRAVDRRVGDDVRYSGDYRDRAGFRQPDDYPRDVGMSILGDGDLSQSARRGNLYNSYDRASSVRPFRRDRTSPRRGTFSTSPREGRDNWSTVSPDSSYYSNGNNYYGRSGTTYIDSDVDRYSTYRNRDRYATGTRSYEDDRYYRNNAYGRDRRGYRSGVVSDNVGAVQRNIDAFTSVPIETVQGGSLKTWTFPGYNVESVQVMLKSEGRVVDAEVELWNGPDYTPQKMKVYLEDGFSRTFRAMMLCPRGGQGTVAVRKNR